MGDTTGIAWTDRTYNPWIGCTKVSQGCRNCYMYAEQERYGNDPRVVARTAPATFNRPRIWHRDRREAIDAGTAPAVERVFTCSWSDWFHEGADDWRGDAWAIVRETPLLTYQILTKRPELARARLPGPYVEPPVREHVRGARGALVPLPLEWGDGWPNVWLGTSVENTDNLWRIRALRDLPARLRFVSFEPLLEPVRVPVADLEGLGWAIVGGESGPGARPCGKGAIRDLVEQLQAARVPVFVKQLGSVAARALGYKDRKGGAAEEWPEELRIREFPDLAA